MGIPPASLARLRSWYAAFAAGGGKGKSHRKVLLLKGDPTWAIATAPLLNFFDLLWAAGMGAPQHAQPHHPVIMVEIDSGTASQVE